MLFHSTDPRCQAYLRGCFLFTAASVVFWTAAYLLLAPSLRLPWQMTSASWLLLAAALTLLPCCLFFRWLERRVWGMNLEQPQAKKQPVPLRILLAVLFVFLEKWAISAITRLLLLLRPGAYVPAVGSYETAQTLAQREAKLIYLLLLVLLFAVELTRQVLRTCRLRAVAEDPWDSGFSTNRRK